MPETGPAPASALRLRPHITGAEAAAVFRRKVPGAQIEVKEVVHPFWWAVLDVRTRGLLGRRRRTGAGPAGRRMNVLVNALSGKGHIADFEPDGAIVDPADWRAALESLVGSGPTVDAAAVARTAAALVRAKVVRTVKLGMAISIAEAGPLQGVLKPNWLVTGSNGKYSATILVDGLDSSHYIVRVQRLRAEQHVG
ncbi:hypothetical protein DFO66_10954 [Brevibacterium sanguinis]|uniref:Uncharacterized protein n=2 Tax=Brevibacterium TaxID=1696 RepID=A0A366IFY9_9MICO|nr:MULTISPECIES: hypothetical protein [Brevibacterium]RBP63624.1 hypothetical protein DFO66_10954 [Brevibacterium sanguinis]RBP70283.1 hypothetical protein DFO65_10954 [Brevibacterium celere]